MPQEAAAAAAAAGGKAEEAAEEAGEGEEEEEDDAFEYEDEDDEGAGSEVSERRTCGIDKWRGPGFLTRWKEKPWQTGRGGATVRPGGVWHSLPEQTWRLGDSSLLVNPLANLIRRCCLTRCLLVNPRTCHWRPQVDIEDIGGAGPRRGKKGAAAAAAANGGGGGGGADGGPPEMLNALIRGSLTKQVGGGVRRQADRLADRQIGGGRMSRCRHVTRRERQRF